MNWGYVCLLLSGVAGSFNIFCLYQFHYPLSIIWGGVALIVAMLLFAVFAQTRVPLQPCDHNWQVAYAAPKKRKARKKRVTKREARG